MLRPIHIKEGMRMFARSRRVKKYGFHRYPGAPEEICRRIVYDCWNGDYFQTSAGHFNEFWTRDFGLCVDALLKLGHKDKVRKTLAYAMERFAKHGHVTTTISPDGKPFDFPTLAVDSLPFLMHALHKAGDKELRDEYESFLLNEVRWYYDQVFDEKTGMVKKRHFSSIKDHAKRKSSTYDNVMVAWLSQTLDAMKFYNPFGDHDIKKRIEKELWQGEYFYDDLRGEESVAGDANTFPFWTGVITSKAKFRKALRSMEEAGLTEPFPLKYSDDGHDLRMVLVEKLASGYERDAIWAHLGMAFIQTVRKFNKTKAKQYLALYEGRVKRFSNFLEVYSPDGSPFETPFYISDESMLWAANLLSLKK